MEHRYHCIIKLLDEQVESINVEFQKDSKGQYLLDQACDALRLAEREYFGLRYVDQRKQRHWLDCKKNALKQLKGIGPPYRVVFRVKFYPADPFSLKEEITRYQLFQQLKRDLLHGRLVCSFQDEALLGACVIQSNLEDYNPEQHLPGYGSYFTMFPQQSEKLQARIEELHQSDMRGLSPAQAEFKFMDIAHKLDTYGVDPHPVQDMYGTKLFMALTFRGVLLFTGRRLVQTFQWDGIRKFSQEGQIVVIHAVANEKKVNHRYWLSRDASAEHLWKCAIENQGFYQSRVTKGLKRSNSFLRRNRYSFSGSTQKEALENSTHLERKEPKVARSPPLIRPRRSLQNNTLRPVSDASTFEGFTTHLALEDHSTPLRDSDGLPPLFRLAPSDANVDDYAVGSSTTDAQPPQPLIVPVLTTCTDGINPLRDPLPNVAEEEEIVETRADAGVCESAAPLPLEESNHQIDRITQRVPDKKDVDVPPSSAYSHFLLLLLLVITSILVVFVLFETDLPLARPLQDSWPIVELRHGYYEPAKQWTFRLLHNFRSSFITPAHEYVATKVDTLITSFQN